MLLQQMYIVKKLVFLHTEGIECTTTQETGMSDALDSEWEKIKDKIREEWEESIV